MVGTGYSYLQDYLPHVAQAVVRAGWIDMVGLGRMVLSYPELPADTLASGATERKKSAARSATARPRRATTLPSGCYPLDPYYKQRPEAEQLKSVKQWRTVMCALLNRNANSSASFSTNRKRSG